MRLRIMIVGALVCAMSGAATAHAEAPRPKIVSKPIPYGAERKADMAAYAQRHYGLDTFRLIAPKVIVEHYTENTSFSATYNTFAPNRPDPELNEKPGTCAHFVIDQNGRIYQLVPITIMCRHTVGLNYTAIGIEHVGTSDAGVLNNKRQMKASLRLTRWLLCTNAIDFKNVIGHAESLSSPYHRERVARLKTQTHGDFPRNAMTKYRSRLKKSGGLLAARIRGAGGRASKLRRRPATAAHVVTMFPSLGRPRRWALARTVPSQSQIPILEEPMYKYFEKNYMWSLAVMRMLCSGALMGEINRAGKPLIDLQEAGPHGDGEAWHDSWHRLAEQLEALGNEAAEAGNRVSAYEYFKRAALYYYWSEAFLPPEDPRKLESLKEMLSTWATAADHSDGHMEIVKIPYEDTTLPGYFLSAGTGEPGPAVVIFGGLDSAKEELANNGEYFAARGISALVMEGPGQGEALKLQGLKSRYDYEVPASAAYDYLASRDDVDPSRIALMGMSMGGYYVGRAAAFEKRFAAIVICGAQYDYRATWVRRMNPEPDAPLPAPNSHLFDVLGVSDWDGALKKLERYTLAGVAEKIEAPIIVTHGELDKQILVEDAHAFFAEVGSEDKELRIFTDEEGGSAHCNIDCYEPAYAYFADWLASRVGVGSAVRS